MSSSRHRLRVLLGPGLTGLWAFIALVGCGAGEWRGGIHARLAWSEEAGLRVVELPAGPARRAGLRVNDRVVAINGTAVEGKDLTQVVELLRGPVGSQVRLAAERRGQPVEVQIERAPYR